MRHTARINLPSGDRVGRIVAKRDGALAGACTRARNVEHGDGTVLSSYEAVTCTADVEVVSDDGSWRVDGLGAGALTGACARARNVERGYGAVRSPHVTVKCIAWVNVKRHSRTLCVDAPDKGTLAGACARTRNVELRDGTVRSSQVAVIHTALIGVVSSDRPRRGKSTDECDKSALAGACARARNVESGESAVWSPQKTVIHTARVDVGSRDCPCRVDCDAYCALAGAC